MEGRISDVEDINLEMTQKEEERNLSKKKHGTTLHELPPSEKNPIHYRKKENKILRNELNQGSKRPVLRKLYNAEERN